MLTAVDTVFLLYY